MALCHSPNERQMMQPIMMTEEQWAVHDKANQVRQEFERKASGAANGLSWRKDQNDVASPSLEVTPDGLVSISIGGLIIQKSIGEWHRLGLALIAQASEPKQVPGSTQSIQDDLRQALPPQVLPEQPLPSKKPGRPAKAQTASV